MCVGHRAGQYGKKNHVLVFSGFNFLTLIVFYAQYSVIYAKDLVKLIFILEEVLKLCKWFIIT